jgi:hypothetical protein
MKSKSSTVSNTYAIKGMATKISKNSVYGVFGKASIPEEPEHYCANCYSLIEDYFFNSPLICGVCQSTDDNYLTKEEMRNAKINDLTNE